VQFARALAQIWEAPPGGTRYLFLDEPISSLDMHFQHQFLRIARSLLRENRENIVLIAVLHDLNLALQYADRMLFMKAGRIAAEGAVPGVVTAGLIMDVFDMPVHILENPYGRAPVIVPAGPG
jgi:iron complex transport system ATP-binding protein